MGALAIQTFDCKTCEDAGKIVTELAPGFVWVEQCTCKPPEYWSEKSDKSLANFKRRFQNRHKKG